MKRTAELRGLSEDHHHGLVQARRLRRAGSGKESTRQKYPGYSSISGRRIRALISARKKRCSCRCW